MVAIDAPPCVNVRALPPLHTHFDEPLRCCASAARAAATICQPNGNWTSPQVHVRPCADGQGPLLARGVSSHVRPLSFRCRRFREAAKALLLCFYRVCPAGLGTLARQTFVEGVLRLVAAQIGGCEFAGVSTRYLD